MTHFQTVALILLAAALLAALAALLTAIGTRRSVGRGFERISDWEAGLREELRDDISDAREANARDLYAAFRNYGELIEKDQNRHAERQNEKLGELSRAFGELSMQSEQRLDNMRRTLREQLEALTLENGRQLEEMRRTVDEKLQETLESRISESFKRVNENLEAVYKGLGEMQNLASGVGDLKKVLSNVKTRGILGEVQLASILEQILAPGQYVENVATRRDSRDRVEFAVKMPGSSDEGRPVLLPIDAKFPGDAYTRLLEAYEDGDRAKAETAGKALESIIRSEARDIRDKYLEPPYTTEFAVMFLPFEGLYAEVLRRGLLEQLQREFKVNIAGPTTMAALLNSLQMGFRTLAIQKRSSEVWELLAAVKTEFEKFGEIIKRTQAKLSSANSDLDQLIGVRTRAITRRLRDVQRLDDGSPDELLGIGAGYDGGFDDQDEEK